MASAVRSRNAARLLAAISIAALLFACGREAPSDDGPGKVVTVRFACGWSDVEFTGRIVFEDGSGVVHGIGDASFHLPADVVLFGRPFRVDLEPDGRFTSTLGIRRSHKTVTSDSETRESEWIQTHDVRMEAPGCVSRTVEFTEGWTERDVVLTCPDRERCGVDRAGQEHRLAHRSV